MPCHLRRRRGPYTARVPDSWSYNHCSWSSIWLSAQPHGVVLGSDCLGSPLNPNMDKHTSIPLPSPRQPDLSQHAASLFLRALRKSPHASHQLYWKAHPAFVCVYRLGRHLCTHSPNSTRASPPPSRSATRVSEGVLRCPSARVP